MRRSRQRELIRELVASTRSHPTALWVYERARRRLPRISLGTVYRNLRLLVGQEILAEHRGGRGPARYEAALSRHYHIRCVRCGNLEDLRMDYQTALDRRVNRRTGYRVLEHQIEVRGVCPACLRRFRGRRKALNLSSTLNSN